MLSFNSVKYNGLGVMSFFNTKTIISRSAALYVQMSSLSVLVIVIIKGWYHDFLGGGGEGFTMLYGEGGGGKVTAPLTEQPSNLSNQTT